MREANLDGDLHVEGAKDCCHILGETCRRCGGFQHGQPVYGGILDVCEHCPDDADFWKPRGTYKTNYMIDGVGVTGSEVVP